jgi:hypothetical protein
LSALLLAAVFGGLTVSTPAAADTAELAREAQQAVELVEQVPAKVVRIDDNTWLVDFGRVAFGNLQIVPPADLAEGQQLTVRFGENLVDGRVDRRPPGTVRYYSVDVALEAAGSDEPKPMVVAPPTDQRNTQQGTGSPPPAVLTPDEWGTLVPFRWVEIEGSADAWPEGSIVRRAVFAKNWNDQAARFECSSETLNRIWELCRYSIKATTFAGVYVDGDRERIPYEADAYLNQLSHYYVEGDTTMARRTFDWLIENPTWPTEWAPHMVFMAHADWMMTGDRQWLADRYDAIKSKLLLDRVDESGLVRSNRQQRSRNDIVDWPVGERDGYEFREFNTVVNAFHIASLERMAQIADAVDRAADAQQFRDQAATARVAFHKLLFDAERGLYRDGADSDHSSLHANFFALAFDLVPEADRPRVAQWLGEQDMRCSVYGAQYFLEALFLSGQAEQALELMVADNDRSWKYMLDRDATITWEAWNERAKPNLDWNHAWGAPPANLLPRFVLGIEPAEPGYQRVRIRPQHGGLNWARGTVPTPHGPITLSFSRKELDVIKIELPAGVEADIDLPPVWGRTRILVNGVEVNVTAPADDN